MSMNKWIWALCGLVPVLLSGCSAQKFIPEGHYMLEHVTVESTDAQLKVGPLKGYIRQHPNSKWFSLLKIPMAPYALSGLDGSKPINKLLQKIGEPPVVYDTLMARHTYEDIEAAVQNLGYLQADVEKVEEIKGKKLKLKYIITPNARYTIRNINYRIDDAEVRRLYFNKQQESYLRSGNAFDLNVLDAERSRIHNLLVNEGYYRFNKEFIRYEADTTIGNHQADVTLMISKYRRTMRDELQNHRKYYLRNITYLNDIDYNVFKQDTGLYRSTMYGDRTIYYKDKLSLRRRLLSDRTWVSKDSLYRENDVQMTYSRLARLHALMGTNIRMEEVHPDSDSLDCYISLLSNRRHSVNTELEGTNSAGDLGAALSLSYQNRNLFRSSELFSLKFRGAFEAITGLEGYSDENYVEFSAEASLTFPDFKFPFLSRAYRRSIQATSEVAVRFDSQNRPEFHRRVLTSSWRYRWTKHNRRLQSRFDLIDLNYVFMPWVSDTFRKDYLDDAGSRNAILRYNYENLFIMKMGYSFSYTSNPGATQNSSYGANAVSVRFNIESSGNLLYGASKLFHAQQNNDAQYTVLNIAYAQYAKADFDLSKSIRIDDRNSLALHFGVGVAYPYGNSTILPYEKRYFSGGANSVRGWSVRELGPGSYTGTDGRIDFINQTGDVKLDLNVEYRTYLFWKLHGALFVDAGNIWTIREYEEQPGGQFHFDTFWKQIAVAYGMGLRLNFGYFILRLDGGMKAINPAYTDRKQHYPILRPNFGRDFTLHFAVGLPF